MLRKFKMWLIKTRYSEKDIHSMLIEWLINSKKNIRSSISIFLVIFLINKSFASFYSMTTISIWSENVCNENRMGLWKKVDIRVLGKLKIEKTNRNNKFLWGNFIIFLWGKWQSFSFRVKSFCLSWRLFNAY